jgi:hypothetical protein
MERPCGTDVLSEKSKLVMGPLGDGFMALILTSIAQQCVEHVTLESKKGQEVTSSILNILPTT